MTRAGHIALAGRPNVGKSSLLNALIGEPLSMVSSKAQATRLPVVGLRTEGEVQYIFHDLPGLLDPAYLLQHRMRALAHQGVMSADVILQLHPAIEGPAPDFLTVADLSRVPRAPVLVVYTKGDLISAERRAELTTRTSLVVSAERNHGLEQLLAAVAALLPEAEFEFDGDDVGTQPVRFFVTEYLREAAFELLEEELPYSVAAEIEEFRETQDPVYIRATLVVERESQKRIVVGAGGSMIKQIGQHARKRTEQLLGRRVYLETRVKVVPKWRQSAAQLVRFGFPELPSEKV